MYEVLRKWEHLVAHIGRCAAATEVCNLIEFIHRRARFRQNRTAAGDKAPSVQISAVLYRDGAVIRHFDIAIITNGTSLLAAASGKIPAAQADGAIDGNGRALAHRQRPESLRRRSRADCRRRIRVQRPCRIKRNQKCNSSRDGISTADGAISSQGDLGLAVCPCVSNRFIQVCKPLTASLKKRQRLAHKLRRNGAVTFDIQGGGCRSRDALACSQVIPAQKLITIRRGRHYLISSHGALRVAVLLGNCLAVHGVGTIFGRFKGCSRRYVRDQCHIRHDDFSSCRAARLDIDLDAGVGRQLLGELAARRDRTPVHLNGAAILFNSIVKRKGCCCRLLICNCQCGSIGCIAACSTRAGSCADNARTIGRPCIICVARKTQSNVLVSQTGHGAAGRRPRRGSHGGQQCQHHQHGKRQ